MDGLGLEALLVYSGLQSFVEEFVDGETENVIEFELFIGEQSVAVHSVEEGGSLEESSGVLFFEGEQFSGGFSEVGEEEMDSPDFPLVAEAVLADELEFVVDSFLLEGSSGGAEGGGI